MAFTIIISEKGGAERRETYDKNEINVGRVQGNDLMLPKGNVSKHHARLLFRDGRFIVTDLKSTNGTYVNGRKITQATIVREGDKIYIGDFIIRLDAAAMASLTGGDPGGGYPPEPAPPPAPPPRMSAGRAPAVPPPPYGGDDGADLDGSTHSVAAHQERASSVPARVSAAPRAPSAAPPAVQPGYGGAPAGNRTAMMGGGSRAPVQARGGQPSVPPPATSGIPMGSSVAVTGGIGPPAAHVGGHGSGAPALDGAARGAVGEALGPSRAPPKESPEHAARRLAFVTLVDRMTEELESSGIQASPQFDEALVSEVEKIARDQVKAMHDEGEAPPGVDMDVLALEAIREVVGLGALAPLIDDEDVSAVHVLRPDHVIVTRGIDVSLADCAYSSEEALELALERLAIQGGAPLRQDELVVERRLPKGIRLYGTRPPLSASVAVTLTRRVRTEHSLEDAIRAGAMSRQMALFLEQCLLARANIMVVGVSRPLVSRFVAALASLSVVGERVVTWLEDGDVSVGGADILSLAPSEMGDRAGPLLEALGGLDFDRFFVGPLHGALANGVYRTIVQGCDGVVATMLAPSARHAVARLSAQVATTGVPHAIDEARDGLGDAFDVWVEVGRSADGRMRLSRVAELSPQDGKVAALRDIFVLVEGAGAAEGVHAATGVVPRCISEFPSRGVRVDASLFRKPGAVRP